jgi:hypothetical protein
MSDLTSILFGDLQYQVSRPVRNNSDGYFYQRAREITRDGTVENEFIFRSTAPNDTSGLVDPERGMNLVYGYEVTAWDALSAVYRTATLGSTPASPFQLDVALTKLYRDAVEGVQYPSGLTVGFQSWSGSNTPWDTSTLKADPTPQWAPGPIERLFVSGSSANQADQYSNLAGLTVIDRVPNADGRTVTARSDDGFTVVFHERADGVVDKVITRDPLGKETTEDNWGSNGDLLKKYYDTQNSHPYDELDVSEDSTSKVTGVQVKLDKDTTTRSTNGSVADLGVIGQVFGSAIGRILAPDNQFGHLLGGTVGGLIGQKLVQNFAASLTIDASKSVNADFTAFSGLDVASAAAGSVASFLIAEIGTKLGVPGYGAQLFNSGASAFTGSILNTVIQKGGLQVLAQEATWATAFATAEGAVGGTVGGIFAQNLVHAESKQGAVGGQLLGAVGSALGVSLVVNQALTGLLNFVIPGVGSFFGTILGTMLGDAIAGDPGYPKSTHDVETLGTDHFINRLVGADDHGNTEVSRKMGDEVVTIANNFLAALHGAAIDHSGKLYIGYSTGAAPYDYVAGWFPNGTEIAPRFTDPNDAIQEGVRELLMQTEVIGGDLLMKRAQHVFITGSHPDPYSEPTNFKDLIGLSGDLRIAQDYEQYLNNREAINALMAANPDSAFTAGWIATFARVADLKLNLYTTNDFLGGLVGYLAANVTAARSRNSCSRPLFA